jgi:hypothetical protein
VPRLISPIQRAHLEGREAEIQLLAQHFVRGCARAAVWVGVRAYYTRQANNGFRDEPPKPKPALGSRERLEAIRKYLVSEMPAYREAKKLGGVAVRQDRLLTALTLRMEFPGLGPKGVMTAKELQDVFDVSLMRRMKMDTDATAVLERVLQGREGRQGGC